MVRNGIAPSIEQDHSKATYEGWCKAKDVVIDWNQRVHSIHDLIRGSDPSPGARTYFNGRELCLYGSTIESVVNRVSPGQVIQVNEEGMLISCNGGVLKVKKLKPLGETKSTSLEWAKSLEIIAGSSLNDTK